MGFKWSLVSIPDHLGVQNVGGRIGAAFGPRAFRESFARWSGTAPGKTPLKDCLVREFELAAISTTVEENHEAAAELIREAAAGADRTVVVGGGHDHGYSQLLGLRRFLGPEVRLGCVNIDAHLDLRKPSPKISSGSPFYLAIENRIIEGRHLTEFGIQSHCNAPELWRYASEHGVEIVRFDSCRHSQAISHFTQSLEKLASQVDAIVVSLDLDSASEAFAPGVSAPQSEGFTSTDLIQICEGAGVNAKVISLGIFELNPLHDLGGRTARLASTCAFHFLENSRDIRV